MSERSAFTWILRCLSVAVGLLAVLLWLPGQAAADDANNSPRAAD